MTTYFVCYCKYLYTVDHVFDMDVGTDELYEKLAAPIVLGLIEGINGEYDDTVYLLLM